MNYLNELRSMIEGQRGQGSLPGISIHDLTGPQVAVVYATLRGRTRRDLGEQTFWDRELAQDRRLSDVAEAAELVIRGHADAFHHCLHAIEAGGVELPPLGIFVYDDEIELDYDPNDPWGWNEIAGLFELLLEIAEIAPAARIALDDEVGPRETARFDAAWHEFLHARRAT